MPAQAEFQQTLYVGLAVVLPVMGFGKHGQQVWLKPKCLSEIPNGRHGPVGDGCGTKYGASGKM